MPVNPYLYTPHEVTWKPQQNRAGSGRKDSVLRTEATLKLFFDPMTPAQAEGYGVIGLNSPYLVIGQADDIERMMRGDLLVWGDKTLEIETAPRVFRPGDGIDSGELMAWDMAYGRQTL